MKSVRLMCITAMAAFPLLAIPVSLAAQDSQNQHHRHQHHHYKFVDLGTLGGPDSVVYGLTRPLNEQGMVSTCATTSVLDPNYPNINPYFLSQGDTYIQHASLWQDGILTDLGTLPGGTSSCEQWISDTGLIVGGSTNGVMDAQLGVPEVHATLWIGGKPFDLGTLGGNESIVWNVNNRGEIAGAAANTIADSNAGFLFPSATQLHASIWRNGVIQDIGTLGTGTDSMAYIVNERGQVSGITFINNTINATTGMPTADPFLWENGKMIDLGTLGGVYGVANAFNNSGESAGYSDLAGDQTSHPFLWTKAKGMQDLGTLGGTFGQAEWMNNSAEVVGLATNAGDQLALAFLWKDGVMTDLNPASDTFGEAEGINDGGQVVGTAQDSQGNSYGFLWENGGPMINLQDLAAPVADLSFNEAVYINNRGEIVGNASLPNGDNHAVVFIPCDENHPGIKGCDYSYVGANVLAEARAAHAIQPSAASASAAKLSPAEMTARLRSLTPHHHRRLGASAF